ncbi:xylulokinase [Flavimaricola marinus]|uniref:Xylulose kinase n=1 Tax=Flavimaricola marinus TaxID=1819565 RepID=A0A238LJ84_9RHOB|nr:FGGY family carbohydrate kinase [Flavimaricola marinus]SMY09777.1 Xylulose kinase [Flavimaricola marinus]
MTELMLAIDIGTSSLKAALVSVDGRVKATARRGYETRIARDGWAEQSPTDWLSALEAAMKDLEDRSELSEVVGLALTGQMSAGLLVDATGAQLTPCLIWSDQRAAAQSARAAKSYGAATLHRLTGNPPSPTYTAPKIAWLTENDPQPQAAAFMQPKDWMVAQLTGRLVTDPSDASCTGLFDLRGGTWSNDLLELYDIPSRLAPEILPSTAVVGPLRKAAAQRLGLTAGLPVVLGGGDGPVAGAGAGTLSAGDANASLGTSAWISKATHSPACDPDSGLATFAHVVPGLALETGAMHAAGGALEWAARLVGTDAASLAQRAISHQATANAPLFLPYLQGERTPHWISFPAGTFIGLSREHGIDDIACAVLEGVMFQLRTIKDVLAAHGDFTPVLTFSGTFGGGAGFGQLLADTLGCDVRSLASAEHTTSLGAAMVGFAGIGRLPDLTAARSWAVTDAAVGHGPRSTLSARRHDLFRAAWDAVAAPSEQLAALTHPSED